MREFFSQFGKVVDSTVMLDRETGRSKGFGFISFEGANVEPILGFGNLEIDGKLVRYLPCSCTSSNLTLRHSVDRRQACPAAVAARKLRRKWWYDYHY